MTTRPEQRFFPAARIITLCRAHPVLVLAVALFALAAAVTAGYILHATRAPPAPAATAGAPPIGPGTASRPAESDAKIRDTVAWRDEAGAIYRAKLGDGRFDEFLRQRNAAIETARSASRDQAGAEILAALKPVFAEMKERVPGYADWYFRYLTRYELMGHAILPAIEYLGRSLYFISPPDKNLIQTVGPYVVAYLDQQYAERVVRPRDAEIRLRAAFEKSHDALAARWGRIIDDEHRAMREFIKEHAGSAERLSADQAAGLELDWDGSREHGSNRHDEGLVDQSFQRGSVSVTLKVPKSAKASGQPDNSGDAPKEADEVTRVIVNLFDRLAVPVVSQMSDMALGVIVGSAAGGSTVGSGMGTGIGGGIGSGIGSGGGEPSGWASAPRRRRSGPASGLAWPPRRPRSGWASRPRFRWAPRWV